MRIIDVHIYVATGMNGQILQKKVWIDTGPYEPKIFDDNGNQLPQQYGDAI
jgi:hypothetical protein